MQDNTRDETQNDTRDDTKGTTLDERGAEVPRPEGDDGIIVIRRSPTCRGWNGIHYKSGMSRQNVGARELSMNVATIPPGGVAAAHVHVGFELMLYIVEGNVRHYFGERLDQVVDNQGGDFIFIEPDIAHEVHNLSDEEPVVAVVARSDADEWQNIAPYPSREELQARADGPRSRPRSTTASHDPAPSVMPPKSE